MSSSYTNIVGTDTANAIVAGTGNDSVKALAGNDTLIGLGGTDVAAGRCDCVAAEFFGWGDRAGRRKAGDAAALAALALAGLGDIAVSFF